MIRFCACLLFIALSGMSTSLKAQNSPDDSLSAELANRYRRISAAKMSRPGYRIQIYFGADRAKAQELRTDFMRTFPEMGAYLIYQQPNFKVRVGDFRSRLEAQGFLKSLNDRYTPSFIVPEEIRLPNFD
jgi:hypothetical protein